MISFQNTMRMNGGLFSLWFACLFVAGLKKNKKKLPFLSTYQRSLFVIVIKPCSFVCFPQMLDII